MKDSPKPIIKAEVNIPPIRPMMVVFISAIVVFIYQGMIHLSPYGLSWLKDGSFSLINLLQFIVIDQILIETITVLVILISMKWYVAYRNLSEIRISAQHLLILLVQFLPLFLVVYFCFAPVTTSLRYLYHAYPDLNWVEYRNDYFFLNKSIYVNYLFPVCLIGYGVLGASILRGKTQQTIVMQGGATGNRSQLLSVKNQLGEQMIATSEITKIQRTARIVWITTVGMKVYRSDQSLAALEATLDPQCFARINRSTILSLDQINVVAYWENQKYVVKNHQGDEFIVSNTRVKALRQKLQWSALTDK